VKLKWLNNIKLLLCPATAESTLIDLSIRNLVKSKAVRGDYRKKRKVRREVR